jgi:hypothetical protein
VPVLVDENDPEATDKAFQDILMTLRAMASNDDRIIDYFRSISQGKRPSKSDTIIDFVVPGPVKVKLGEFVENIETQTWHKLAKLSWMPFEEAREFARELKLNGREDWRRYVKGELPGKPRKPVDIPADPAQTYTGKGWTTMGNWLGTGVIAPRLRVYWPLRDARAFVHSLKLKGRTDWRRYCLGEMPDKPPKPSGIPAGPERTYKHKGWKGWGDWLGTGAIAPFEIEYWPFQKARTFARRLKLNSNAEWRKYLKSEMPWLPSKPDGIPAGPVGTYANKGWISWGDWLGTGAIASIDSEYWPLEKARLFVHSLELKSNAEWRRYCKGEMLELPIKPEYIPAGPDRTYKNKGWKTWGDWLGNEAVSNRYRQFRPFKQARAFAHSLNLGSQQEWFRYRKGEMADKQPKPEDIPSNPYQVYEDKGWISWPDWLGKE